jgi:pimeloyl-ACP methyl ester carboxylesterase
MNPSFLDDDHLPVARRPSRWRRVFALLGKLVKLLFTDVRHRHPSLRDETGTRFSRFLRALLYRLMLVPTVLAVLVGILVVTATHPRSAPAVIDPVSRGVYYDPIEFLSLDNTKLEGWLVPVLDARRLVIEKEDLLHRKYAAIVLVHDFGASRQQVLPLVSPLHDAGYVVLALNLRGHGPSSSTGSTFGLNEAQDVRAAVDLLRRRPYVDPDAVGVLGIGTGATAALRAAEQDPRLNVLVLDHPVRQFQDILDQRIGPRQPWLSWVRPICKMTFELCYHVDADSVDLSTFSDLVKQKQVLMFDQPGETVTCLNANHTREIVQFLKKHLKATNKAITKLIRPAPMNGGRVSVNDNTPAAKDDSGSKDTSWPPQRSAEKLLERSGNAGY